MIARCLFSLVLLVVSVDHAKAADTYYWRPSLHWTPNLNWVNDPNGLIYDEATQLWHLFAQYNPYDNVWGSMSWAHAVSRDLITWKQLPVAILTGESVAIFSGSAVMDHNTSGLCVVENKPCMVAVWAGDGEGKQTINLASSVDVDMTVFNKYANNPVIDIGSDNFRDPAAFWYDKASKTRSKQRVKYSDDGSYEVEDGYWITAIAHSDQSKVEIWQSTNLIKWSKVSEFNPGIGGSWECPDLFPMKLANGSQYWVLSVSISGTTGSYFIGQFDGTTFTASSDHSPVDFGVDFYASITYNDAPNERRVQIGWLDNWSYAASVPTSPYRGGMTLPRELTLHEHVDVKGQTVLYVHAVPAPELAAYRQKHYSLSQPINVAASSSGSIVRDLLQFPGGSTYEVTTRVNSTCASPPCSFVFRVRHDDFADQSMDIGLILPARGQPFITTMNRANSGNINVDAPYVNAYTATAPSVKEAIDRSAVVEFRFVVDASALEVFIQDGLVAASYQFLPTPSANNYNLDFVVTSGEFTVQSMDIHTLEIGATFKDE